MDWQLGMTLEREVKIRYPAGRGHLSLRCELNWDQDIYPERLEEEGNLSIFQLRADRPFLYFKPVLKTPDGKLFWATGSNILALMSEPGVRVAHPKFFSGSDGHFLDLIELDSRHLNRTVSLRIYLPGGYAENHLARYRLALMQDGQNLFFPEESFMGNPWDVDETLSQLNKMNAIDQFIVCGIHSADRMQEYTQPGYEAYGRCIVEEVMPFLKSQLRLRPSRIDRMVMGSSLGGVVSFYLAWQYPDEFAGAACMSSTFTFRDDLLERVYSEPQKPVGFYLDSGWPGDNYEVNLAMATALLYRGWKLGHDLQHFTFPNERHNESAWGRRLHIPAQVFARSLREINAMRHGAALQEAPTRG